ncbi:MAG: hypothetical protein ACI9MC_001278 [Kiritimatiellia bacterium]
MHSRYIGRMHKTARSAAAVVLGTWMLSATAHAQEGQSCSWSIGTAGNLAAAGRGWDLTTPGNVAWSVSPVLSQQCSLYTEDRRARTWIGVDATPTLRHSYRTMATRGSLIALMHMGVDFRVADGFAWWGFHAVHNIAAWGVGTRLLIERAPKSRFGFYGVEGRLNYIPGTEADVQGVLLLRFHSRWTGTNSEEDNLPQERWQSSKKISLRTGFDAGPLLAWRFEAGLGGKTGVEIGTRVGILTNFFAETAVQPTGLLYIDIPVERDAVVQLELSGGPTLRDGTIRPMAGVAAQLDPWDTVLQAQLGVLIWRADDRNFASADVGFSWVW